MSELVNESSFPDPFEASDAVSLEVMSPEPDNPDVYDTEASDTPDLANPPTRRELLRDAAVLGIAAALLPNVLSGASGGTPIGANPPLAPSPGSPLGWQESVGVYSGVVNLATGNLLLSLPICGWGGTSPVAFGLVFNSQTSRTSPLGGKWTHSYRSYISGTSPAIVVDDDGTETSFTLSGSAYTAPTGIYDTLVKNSDGTWTRTLKGRTTMTYNANGTLNTVKDRYLPNLVTCVYGPYSGGKLTQLAGRDGRTLNLAYDPSGRLSTVTDPLGRVWTLGYDANNRLTSISEPALNGTTYTRNVAYISATNANIASITDRRGKTWGYTYVGTSNQFATTTDSLTNLWSLAYFVDASLSVNPFARWTDARLSYTDTLFDTLGRAVQVANPLSQITKYGWDSGNNRTSVTTPSNQLWQYGYDGRGNLTSEIDPYTKQTIRTYDRDFLKTVTDPLGHQTVYTYDADAPYHGGTYTLLSVKDANNKLTTYTYNYDGTVSTVTDAEGRKTLYGYDSYGHQTSVKVYRDSTNYDQTSYVYNATSQMTSRTDARGRVTNYTLDAWGRRTATAYPTSGRTGVTLTLDPNGNVTQAVDPTGTRQFTYDAWGRKTQLVDPMGTTNAYYDPNGNLTSQTDAAGRTLLYSYDALNRIATVSEDGNTTQAVYAYLPDGGTDTLTYPNGTQAKSTYDNAGRLLTLTHKNTATNTVIVAYTSTYDDAGRLTQVSESPSGAVTTYGYDNVDRLTSEGRVNDSPYSGSYSYDGTGQRKTATVITNGTTTHSGTYTYDGAGRLSQVVDTASSLTETYGWNADSTLSSYPTKKGYSVLPDYDEEGRLISLTRKDNATNALTKTFEYGYAFDGGRRYKKDYTLPTPTQTWFPCGVACSAGELVEMTRPIDTSGNPTGSGNFTTSATYLRGGSGCSGNGILKQSTANGAATWRHSDGKGNTAFTTNSSGSVNPGSAQVMDAFGVKWCDPNLTQAPHVNTAQPCGDYTDNGDEGLGNGDNGSCPQLTGRDVTLCYGPPKQKGPITKTPPKSPPKRDCASERDLCRLQASSWLQVALVGAAAGVTICVAICATSSGPLAPVTTPTCIVACTSFGAVGLGAIYKHEDDWLKRCEKDYKDCLKSNASKA